MFAKPRKNYWKRKNGCTQKLNSFQIIPKKPRQFYLMGLFFLEILNTESITVLPKSGGLNQIIIFILVTDVTQSLVSFLTESYSNFLEKDIFMVGRPSAIICEIGGRNHDIIIYSLICAEKRISNYLRNIS